LFFTPIPWPQTESSSFMNCHPEEARTEQREVRATKDLGFFRGAGTAARTGERRDVLRTAVHKKQGNTPSIPEFGPRVSLQSPRHRRTVSVPCRKFQGAELPHPSKTGSGGAPSRVKMIGNTRQGHPSTPRKRLSAFPTGLIQNIGTLPGTSCRAKLSRRCATFLNPKRVPQS